MTKNSQNHPWHTLNIQEILKKLGAQKEGLSEGRPKSDSNNTVPTNYPEAPYPALG